MKKPAIQQALQTLHHLSPEDLLALERAVQSRKQDLEVAVLLQQKTESVTACPHCGSLEIKKNGSKDGRARFKCKETLCGKSFNVLTGTPLARLRKIEQQVDYAQCLIEGKTVRASAEKLSIHRNTAFRWRHRFLRALETIQPVFFNGLVEADETYFRESFKGRKNALSQKGRKPKKRGTPAQKRGLSQEQIPVLVARDRATGKTPELCSSRTKLFPA